MNTTTVQRRYRYRRLEVKGKGKPNPIIWKVVPMLGCFLALGVYYVWLISANAQLDRDLRRLQKAYSDGCKQLENVRMEMESYKSGHYILTQVQNMNLNLHPPYPGQVRRVSLEGRQNRADYSEDGLVPMLPPDLAQRANSNSGDVVYP